MAGTKPGHDNRGGSSPVASRLDLRRFLSCEIGQERNRLKSSLEATGLDPPLLSWPGLVPAISTPMALPFQPKRDARDEPVHDNSTAVAPLKRKSVLRPRLPARRLQFGVDLFEPAEIEHR